MTSALIFVYCGAIFALPRRSLWLQRYDFRTAKKPFSLTTAAQNIHVLFRKSPLHKKHFFEWLKTAITSTACGTVTLKSLLPQAFAVSDVHPRPRKRLARCTLDCGFKTSESPALRGFEAERAPIRGTSLYLVLKSNGLHHSKNLPEKFGFLPIDTPANMAKKLPPQRCSKPFLIPLFNFSHKRSTFAFTHESGYTLGFRRRIAHKGLHGETGAFLPSATAWLCAASEIHFIPPCFYIHTFPGSMWTTTIGRRRKSGKAAVSNSISNRFSSRFSTSRTNGPRLPSLPKAGTHSAFGERSHTRAHTAKQGRFGWGVVSLPSERSTRSQTSPGRVSEWRTLPLLGLGLVCSRRTQRACGTAMRLCASLSRGVAAPLGCVIQ